MVRVLDTPYRDTRVDNGGDALPIYFVVSQELWADDAYHECPIPHWPYGCGVCEWRTLNIEVWADQEVPHMIYDDLRLEDLSEARQIEFEKALDQVLLNAHRRSQVRAAVGLTP